MGKVVVSEFTSLDGVIEDPAAPREPSSAPGRFRFPADDGQQFKFEELMASEVQLLGRVTYEEFAAAWPPMEETTGEFGAKMNAMSKVVVSATLSDPTWRNTTVARCDLPTIVARLKDQYDGDILVAGSATLVAGPREHDLVGEYRLMLHRWSLAGARSCSLTAARRPICPWSRPARSAPTCCSSPIDPPTGRPERTPGASTCPGWAGRGDR